MIIWSLIYVQAQEIYTLQILLQKTSLYFSIFYNAILVVVIFLSKAFREQMHPTQVSKFENSGCDAAGLLVNKKIHLIPPTLPPLPKGVCILRCGVGRKWLRSPKSLRAYIYLDPGKMENRRRQWKGVCCAKTEETGKEEWNSILKISLNERRERYKIKDT